MQTGKFTRGEFRKSMQWFGLTRKHAELVIADVEINREFEEHCHWEGGDNW